MSDDPRCICRDQAFAVNENKSAKPTTTIERIAMESSSSIMGESAARGLGLGESAHGLRFQWCDLAGGSG